MFQAVAATSHGDHPEVGHDPLERVDHCRDGGITDDVKSRGDFRLGAGSRVCFHRWPVQVAGSDAAGLIGIGLMQPGGTRPERPVHEEITGQAARARFGHQRARLGGSGNCLTPVADHLDTVRQGGELQPVVEPTDFGAAALMHRDDAGGRQRPQRRGPRLGELWLSQQIAGAGADQVVGFAGQGPLLGEPGGLRQVRDQPAQARGGQRGMDVDSSQVCGPFTEHRVELSGAGGDVLRPCRLIPAMAPQRLARVRRGVVGSQLQAPPQ